MSHSEIARQVDDILTKLHDKQMNNYGFGRDSEGHWVGRFPVQDYGAGAKANALYMARCLVRRYFNGRDT